MTVQCIYAQDNFGDQKAEGQTILRPIRQISTQYFKPHYIHHTFQGQLPSGANNEEV